LKKKKAKE